jgi:myo-inositol catabolism protein IolC
VGLGYDDDLYILAFDHRGSFQKGLFGIEGKPNAEETERIADAKRLVFEGFLRALDEGAPREQAGLLVDEQFGADLARKAKADGLILSMPVEKSGQDEFDFEYGDEFGEHIEEFDPTFAKVLVRYNTEAEGEMNARQAERLRRLSDWLHERDRKLLFELLVPATESQLAGVSGDAARFDGEVRPRLMVEAIEELKEAGVDPDVWKIEGLDEEEDCRMVAEAARAGGRDGVVCIVLGRGADETAVEHWLRTGAAVEGFAGFAVGRTIWWDALKAQLDGSLDRAGAAAKISDVYRRMIEVYRSARS